MRRSGSAVVVGTLVGLLACVRPEPPPVEPAPAVAASTASPRLSGPPAVAPASASASVSASASASVSASASASASDGGFALLPDGCPAPFDGLTEVTLVGPLGPASEASQVEPPRCFPRTIEYGRYMNARFALAADIPRFLEKYGSGSANGDGASFVMGKEIEISVWGAHNHELASGMSEEKTRISKLDEARQVAPGEALISAVREGNAIVRISTQDGKRTMRKSILEDRLEASVSITYDASRVAYFEPIEQRLRDSLRTTTGGMYNRPRKPKRHYPKD